MLGTQNLWMPFSSIFRKIIHPGPINQQESKRLLDALTTSFRKNLDKEHGSLSSPSPSSSSSRQRSSPVDRPTDRHVRAILSNPLFSHDPSYTSSTPSRTSDPMAVFDRAVAQGLMTPDRAAGVLIAHKSVARSLSSASAPSSDVALRVVQWLRSSGLERDLSFIACHRLVNQLVACMVGEGLEEIAWIWLDRWMRGEGLVLSQKDRMSHASILLIAIINARVTPLASMDRGYVAMVRADDMFSHHPGYKRAACHPWLKLSEGSTAKSAARPQPSEALFDSFSAIAQHCNSHPALGLYRAHLDLYHPTHPDAALALDYLMSPQPMRLEKILNHELEHAQMPPPFIASSLVKLINMTADAARHLANTGQDAKAEWVRSLLRRYMDTQSKLLLPQPTALAT